MSAIHVFAKNMAGEVLPLFIDPIEGVARVRRILSRALAIPPSDSIHILRGEREMDDEKEALYEGEVLSYVIAIREYYILNLTTGFYAVCQEDGPHHNDIMKKFMTPLTAKEALLSNDYGTSHWLHTDKIVFVPSHLRTFVSQNYSRLA
jgi:hypothetical protein